MACLSVGSPASQTVSGVPTIVEVKAALVSIANSGWWARRRWLPPVRRPLGLSLVDHSWVESLQPVSITSRSVDRIKAWTDWLLATSCNTTTMSIIVRLIVCLVCTVAVCFWRGCTCGCVSSRETVVSDAHFWASSARELLGANRKSFVSLVPSVWESSLVCDAAQSSRSPSPYYPWDTIKPWSFSLSLSAPVHYAIFTDLGNLRFTRHGSRLFWSLLLMNPKRSYRYLALNLLKRRMPTFSSITLL